MSAAAYAGEGTPGRGVIPSPNIWSAPDVYEVENRASDHEGRIDAAIDALHPWAGSRVLDVGCGSGFHLPRFAGYAAGVLGVEPHLPLVRTAAARLRASLPGQSDPNGHFVPPARRTAAVIAGSAEALPVANASVDIVHARWAYFFGPGCEPGLAEVERVLRPGGLAVFVDNDVSTDSTFSRWFAAAYPAFDPEGIERFWHRTGFEAHRLTIQWRFESRADLEAVVGIEFPPEAAARFLGEHAGLSVDYAVVLRWRRAPG
ncbi:MAG TPA: class I SAM-dependent methyltransferase [Phycicoccus sp.]|nr:class I SAM-dependent methyltransferase [Phycicoccus sp.]